MACPDCFKGAVHEGEPRGKVTRLYGLDAYVSEPPNGGPVKGVIVIIPDAFGWEFVNNRILADHYAEKGSFKVYLPEFMAGNSAPLWMLDVMPQLTTASALGKLLVIPKVAYGFVPFLIKNRLGVTLPRVKSFISQIRADQATTDLPIGVAGFCWGGKHTVLLANADEHTIEGTGKPYLDAGFTGHPSGLTIPDNIEKMTLPVAFAIGENDVMLTPDMAVKIKSIIEAKPEGRRGELRNYSKCGHGFCVRAEAGDVRQQAADAEDQCIAWFESHFKLSK